MRPYKNMLSDYTPQFKTVIPAALMEADISTSYIKDQFVCGINNHILKKKYRKRLSLINFNEITKLANQHLADQNID